MVKLTAGCGQIKSGLWTNRLSLVVVSVNNNKRVCKAPFQHKGELDALQKRSGEVMIIMVKPFAALLIIATSIKSYVQENYFWN